VAVLGLTANSRAAIHRLLESQCVARHACWCPNAQPSVRYLRTGWNCCRTLCTCSRGSLRVAHSTVFRPTCCSATLAVRHHWQEQRRHLDHPVVAWATDHTDENTPSLVPKSTFSSTIDRYHRPDAADCTLMVCCGRYIDRTALRDVWCFASPLQVHCQTLGA